MLLTATKIAWRLALALCLVVLAVVLWRLPSMLDTVIRDEAQATRQAAVKAVEDQGARLDKRLSLIQKDANQRVSSASAQAFNELRMWRTNTDIRLSEVTGSVARVASQVDSTLQDVARLRDDALPVLSAAQELLAQSSGTVAVLRPQLLGLTAAAKVTLGEAAQSARTIDASMPRLVSSVDQVLVNSNRTTAETSRLMGNLARATKPLPTWMRIGLSVAPPLAGTAAGVATTLALTGRLGK